jgi:hypothetical protein
MPSSLRTSRRYVQSAETQRIRVRLRACLSFYSKGGLWRAFAAMRLARRPVATSRRPARSRCRPPQWLSQPKLRSTTSAAPARRSPSDPGSSRRRGGRMPCRLHHCWQRSAVKAPSKRARRRLGHVCLPASSAGSVSRSCTLAGTTASARTWPWALNNHLTRKRSRCQPNRGNPNRCQHLTHGHICPPLRPARRNSCLHMRQTGTEG